MVLAITAKLQKRKKNAPHSLKQELLGNFLTHDIRQNAYTVSIHDHTQINCQQIFGKEFVLAFSLQIPFKNDPKMAEIGSFILSWFFLKPIIFLRGSTAECTCSALTAVSMLWLSATFVLQIRLICCSYFWVQNLYLVCLLKNMISHSCEAHAIFHPSNIFERHYMVQSFDSRFILCEG